MKANHTKGPWGREGHLIWGPKHIESRHQNGRVLIAEVKQGSARADAMLEGGADRFGFDSEADGDLIAAAPDLLEALEAIEWTGPNDWESPSDCCPYCGKHERKGHADDCLIGNALKKARGDS